MNDILEFDAVLNAVEGIQSLRDTEERLVETPPELAELFALGTRHQ